MNFEIDPEQQLMQDTLRRFFKDHYGLEHRRRFMGAGIGFSESMWSRYAELGLLALPFSQEYGGFESSPAVKLVTMQELGRALVLEPYLETVIVCGGLLRHAAPAGLRSRVIPKIIEGSLILTFAHEGNLSPGSCVTAEKMNSGHQLEGNVPLVVAGASAHQILVPARCEGRTALFLVDRQAEGVAVRSFPLHDGTQAAALSFKRVFAEQECVVSVDAEAAIERVMDEANAAVCADIVGAMEEAFELTRDYLNTRRQFGMPIGSFQALRHRVADMAVGLEHARSMAILAVIRSASDDAVERRRAVSSAKVHVSGAARLLGQAAIQLHGGVGMTDDYKLGHLFKRMESLGKRFGDVGSHLTRLAAVGGAIA